MPDDLIPRPRARQDPLSNEAADEIQALREESGGREVASEMWQEQAQQNATRVERLEQALQTIERHASWTGDRLHAHGFEPTCPLCVARRALGIRNPIEETRKEPPA